MFRVSRTLVRAGCRFFGTSKPVGSALQREYFAHRQNNSSETWIKVGAGVGVFGVGYYFFNLEPVPYTGRKHMIDMSRSSELSMGEKTFKQMLEKYKGRILHPDHPLSRRVRSVGERIARAANISDFKWEFIVVDSPQVNAFCLPGGKIVFYTGLLNRLQSDENFIASVMGHEVAHAVARHGAEQLGFSKFLVPISILLEGFMNIPLSSRMMNLALSLPKSRKLELEADYIGLLLMAKACYDPRTSFEVERRINHGSKAPPEYFSTHPNMESRVVQLKEKMPEALRIFNQCQASSSWAFSRFQ